MKLKQNVKSNEEILKETIGFLKSLKKPMSYEEVKNLSRQHTASKNIDIKHGKDSKKETLFNQEVFEMLYKLMKYNKHTTTADIDLELLNNKRFASEFLNSIEEGTGFGV